IEEGTGRRGVLPFLEASVSFGATVHGLGIEERSRAASAIRRQVHSCKASQPFCKSRDDSPTPNHRRIRCRGRPPRWIDRWGLKFGWRAWDRSVQPRRASFLQKFGKSHVVHSAKK